MIGANTRAELLRGETENDYGDPVDSSEPVEVRPGVFDFPASIVQRRRMEQDADTGTPRLVEYTSVRVPPYVEVRQDDRIRDTRDGAVYTLDGKRSTPRGLSGRASVTLSMRRGG